MLQITLITSFWIISNSSHSTLVVVPKNILCITFKPLHIHLTSQPTHCFMLQAKHIQMTLLETQNSFILNYREDWCRVGNKNASAMNSLKSS